MVKRKNIDEKVSASIMRFATRVKAIGFPIHTVILFGSWARGLQNKDSDIDICLVSPEFGKDEIEELQLLIKQTRDIDDRLEPMPISLSDYISDATPLILEIKKHGLEFPTRPQ